MTRALDVSVCVGGRGWGEAGGEWVGRGEEVGDLDRAP